jgi:hypothetical protein
MKLYEVVKPDAEDLYWRSPKADDLWALDKLILSKKLGYNCGPAGIDVPVEGDYIVRPCVNVFGLGMGAKKMHLELKTNHLPLGTFWCEWFEGRHLTVDYEYGKQIRCVEGFKPEDTLQKWDKWIKTDDEVPLHPLIKKHFSNKPKLNCEYIGGKLIEMHFRHNVDFEGDRKEYIPVWKGQSTEAPSGYKYIEHPDIHGRIGAFVR